MICGTLALIFGVWCWVRFFTRYPERTVRDVYPFFHRVEGGILAGSFHPEPDDNFRAIYNRAEFKKWQYKRIHLAMHLCRHISANCHLLQDWATYERKQNLEAHSEAIRAGLREFQVVCMHARTAAFAVRFRLRLWLLRMNMLPILPVPSFRTLAEHSNTLINFYGTAETLAESISRMYREDVHENMLAVLGMVEMEADGTEE